MVFPTPHSRETIASYGYRIARLSGLGSLPELTYLFDLDLAALQKGDDLSLARFAKYTGCDPTALANGALSTWSPQRLQMGAKPDNAAQCDTQRMRVCPACLEGLAEQDFTNVCLGRTEWLVRSNHVCAAPGLRLVTLTPDKTRRVHPDLSPMIPSLELALRQPHVPDAPTALERYIVQRLDGHNSAAWADGIRLDVVIHTAEVLGAMAARGPQANWDDIKAKERRRHGEIGAEVLLARPEAIKTFLAEHVRRGRQGNDYRYAFGKAFDAFYFRKDQPAYRPICEVLAAYVGENFYFTHHSKVFGIRARGIEPKSLRVLCARHGIGAKITALVLKAQTKKRVGLDHEVDPAVIAELAPQLKGLLNMHDAARHLAISLDVFRVLLADGLIEPDYKFNRRMAGFRPETLNAFLVEWAGFGRSIPERKRQKTLNLMIVARSHFTRTPLLLRAARKLGLELFRDRRKRGLAAVMISERDVAELIEEARAERGRRDSDRQGMVAQR